MLTRQQEIRRSIVLKGGGMLACDWVTGINTLAFEVLSSPSFLSLLSQSEVAYLNTLDHWSKRVLYRQFSALAKKLTEPYPLEVFVS